MFTLPKYLIHQEYNSPLFQGLSHDGDLGAGNTCKKESNEGSVMAPMVAATFSYFHWSSCSAGEYHYKSNEWKCMKNKPKGKQHSLQLYIFQD